MRFGFCDPYHLDIAATVRDPQSHASSSPSSRDALSAVGSVQPRLLQDHGHRVTQMKCPSQGLMRRFLLVIWVL